MTLAFRNPKATFLLQCMQIKWLWDLVHSPLRGSLTDPMEGILASFRVQVSQEQVKEEGRGSLRNLNRRTAPLERSHCSFRLTRSPHFGFADSPLG